MMRHFSLRLMKTTAARLASAEIGSQTEVQGLRTQAFHKRMQGHQMRQSAPKVTETAQNKFALGFKPRTDYEDFTPFGKASSRQDWFEKLQPNKRFGMKPATRTALGLFCICASIYGYCFYRFGQDDFSDVVIPQRPDIIARAEKQLELEQNRLA